MDLSTGPSRDRWRNVPLPTPEESGAGKQAPGEPSGFGIHVVRAQCGNLRRRRTGGGQRAAGFLEEVLVLGPVTVDFD